MKALTVQQPWAWAIFHGKPIENRSVAWWYRGPLAIHASRSWSTVGQRSPLIRAAWRTFDATTRFLPAWFTRGAIIGVVDLVDVHHAAPDATCCESPWAEARYRDSSGHEVGSVAHLVLANPREFTEPIPCKGRLGLWTPTAEVLAEIDAQL